MEFKFEKKMKIKYCQSVSLFWTGFWFPKMMPSKKRVLCLRFIIVFFKLLTDLGFVVLCAAIFLVVFNIVCVFIFYRKWKKR